jgi:hypothetical protein
LDLYVTEWWSRILIAFSSQTRDTDVQSIIDDFGELIYREIDATWQRRQTLNDSMNCMPESRTCLFPRFTRTHDEVLLTMEWCPDVAFD